MSIAQSLLSEFDDEAASTREVLERVPADHVDFRPHPKSLTLGELALHVANLPSWGSMIMTTEELDINPPGSAGYVPPKFESLAAVLAAFERNAGGTRALIASASDEDFNMPWSLKSRGVTVARASRFDMMRRMVLNHTIHHRAQLGVYLRLLDIKLPPIYGPTADEPPKVEAIADTADHAE